MKRNVFKAFATFFVMASMIFAVSCNKEKEDNGTNQNNQNEQPTINSLVGTTWGYSDNGEESFGGGMAIHYTTNVTVTFQTNSTGSIHSVYECVEYPEQNEDETISFSYTYNAPNGTMTATVDGMTQTISFTVSGNTLTLISPDPEDEPIILTRQ